MISYEPQDRLALLFSDGSLSVFEHFDVARAHKHRESDDRNETRPEKLTKVVRVSLQIMEVLPSTPAMSVPACCPACGR